MKDQRSLTFFQKLQENPKLIQRIKKGVSLSIGAVTTDHNLYFDYMGSAEFEFGALPAALNFMQQAVHSWGALPLVLQADTRKAYYVGTPELHDRVNTFFNIYLNSASYFRRDLPFLQENPHIAESYRTDSSSVCEYIKCCGWLALDAAPCPWAFFKEEADAETWLQLLKNKKKKR